MFENILRMRNVDSNKIEKRDFQIFFFEHLVLNIVINIILTLLLNTQIILITI